MSDQQSSTTSACSARFRIVPPADGKGETQNVLKLICCILLVTAVCVHLRARKDSEMPLENWQLSAFHHLEGTDQAVFNALYIAAQDIVALHHEAGHWPTVKELQDYYIPPFTKDLSWVQWGKVRWKRITPMASASDAVVYLGSKGRSKGQGAYLLVMSHLHTSATARKKGKMSEQMAKIWLNADPKASAPDTFIPDSLVRNGWKQIVPYKGDMEVKRLKG